MLTPVTEARAERVLEFSHWCLLYRNENVFFQKFFSHHHQHPPSTKNMIEGARKASDQLKHCYETLCMTDLK
jgi:hypothetical protein